MWISALNKIKKKKTNIPCNSPSLKLMKKNYSTLFKCSRRKLLDYNVFFYLTTGWVAELLTKESHLGNRTYFTRRQNHLWINRLISPIILEQLSMNRTFVGLDNDCRTERIFFRVELKFLFNWDFAENQQNSTDPLK